MKAYCWQLVLAWVAHWIGWHRGKRDATNLKPKDDP